LENQGEGKTVSHLQSYLGRVPVALLFCIIALSGTTSIAGADAPAEVIPNDPGVALWELPEYWRTNGILQGWAISEGLPTAKVAIVDSGINPGDDMALNPKDERNFYRSRSKDMRDKLGHGTAVASIVAARINNGIGTAGVCPFCRLMSAKITGASWDASPSAVAEAIIWATDHGARVINLSLSFDQSDHNDPDLREAISYADANGALVVTAAGNGKNNDGVGTDDPSANTLPADNPETLRVAAADAPDSIAYFSNHGSKLADVAAYGECVPADRQNDKATSSKGCPPADDTSGVIYVSGTSVAAAVVSGIAGLIFSEHPDFTPAQVKAIIMGSCSKVGLDVRCGGVVSAYQALALAKQNPPKSVYLHVKMHGKGKVWISGQVPCKTSDCRYSMIAEQITLAAAAGSGWHFVGWKGAISSKNPRLTVNLQTALIVKAVFAKNKSKVKRR
jgi:subtilisin family serine protease